MRHCDEILWAYILIFAVCLVLRGDINWWAYCCVYVNCLNCLRDMGLFLRHVREDEESLDFIRDYCSYI